MNTWRVALGAGSATPLPMGSQLLTDSIKYRLPFLYNHLDPRHKLIPPA